MAISKIKLPDNSTEEIHDSRVHGVKIFYGTCNTGASTGTKVVTCPEFTSNDLENGTILIVKNAVGNEASVSSLKLNVNSTGAVPVRELRNQNETTLYAVGNFAGSTLMFVLSRWVSDPTQVFWVLVNSYSNTTYSTMSQANIDAGTGTTGYRVTPKLLRDNFYTEDEVDALISAATEIPTLYIGDTNSPLTTEQKAHNLETFATISETNQQLFPLTRVKLLDVSTDPLGNPVVLVTTCGSDTDNEYTISFLRIFDVGAIFSQFTSYSQLSLNGDLSWGALASKNILLSNSISTNLYTDKSDNNKVSSAKAVYDEVHPLVGSYIPATGMLPNKVIYELGELEENTTFLLNTTDVDNNISNHYYWMFDMGSTLYTITWPANITWAGGSAPTISANKHYEVSILDGMAVCMEA